MNTKEKILHVAERMFADKGFVCGAVYDNDYSVVHIVTDDPSKLSELRSSKYLQSNSGSIYTIIKGLLDTGRLVLVCGTPCQISALSNFINGDYSNLIKCDFICRGVNSPKVFQKYMKMLEEKHGAKAVKIKFKDKTFGWHRFAMKVDFENGSSYCKDRYNDPFFVGYLQFGNFARPSCYACKFKEFPRASDITLAGLRRLREVLSLLKEIILHTHYVNH